MSKIIDTHCHLNDPKLASDLDRIITDAKANHIESIIVMGYDEASSKKTIEIANQYPECYAAIGLQPQEKKPENLLWLRNLITSNKVVCIGEIGIDLYWPDNDPLEIQAKFFREQLTLAVEFNLPVSIHARNAIDEVLAIIREFKGQVKGVIHCFTEDLTKAEAIIKDGLYLGIGGVLTYKNAKDLKEVIKVIDLKHIVLETDAPYLCPLKYIKNKLNEPAYLYSVAEEIAMLKNISVDEVIKITSENARKLFRI